MERRKNPSSVKRQKNSLCVQICFEVTSPWEAEKLLDALTAISGYQITLSPRLPVLNEILTDEEAYSC